LVLELRRVARKYAAGGPRQAAGQARRLFRAFARVSGAATVAARPGTGTGRGGG